MSDRPPPAMPTRPAVPASYGIASVAEGMLPWRYVQEGMAQARNYWIGTTRPDGRPHVMPVWGLWLDEAFYFSTDPTSRKARNLAARPDVVVHLESGDEVVVFEGTAERVAPADAPPGFADAYEAKYGFRIDPTNPDYGLYRLHPRAAYAWRERDYPQSATRWRVAPD